MKRMTYFVMALAMVLGLAQCKKEQPVEPQGEQVRITLNVSNGNGSKAEVNPPHVNFVNGDQILVASDNHYVGTLTHNGTNFSGNVTNPTEGEPLYFYFLGNKQGAIEVGADECTVNISDQTYQTENLTLPVISMGVSIDRANHKAIVTYSSEVDSYEAQLHNKASLMKFNVNTDSDAAICIKGMNNEVTVNFGDPTDSGFTYGMNTTDGGLIKMAAKNAEGITWAIVLPQTVVNEGEAYTEDGIYTGTRPAIEGGIEMNQYYHEGDDVVSMTLDTYTELGTPLTLEAKVAGTQLIAPDGNLQYKINDGAWTDYVFSWEDLITLPNVGDKISFRGNNVSFMSGDMNMFLLGEGECYVYGNVMSILYKDSYVTETTLPGDYALAGLFGGVMGEFPGIFSHEEKRLLLPATTLTQACYQSMFQGCTNLTTPPELSATVLANGCYVNMFAGCTSLASAPQLNATTLADQCYGGMFDGCTSLASAPQLPATSLTTGCYSQMFQGCTSLTTAPELPATDLEVYCYYAMFKECTSLTQAPELPAATLVVSCYEDMFNQCWNLHEVTCLATNIEAHDCTNDWLLYAGVDDWNVPTFSGTLHVAPSMASVWPTNSYSGVPTGWTIEAPAPEGAIDGKFSVSATKQVWFSQGNLKYSNGTWSFHTNQYDRCFTSNGNVSSSYNASGTFDLFGWGTSGYNGMNPYMTVQNNNQYASGINEIAGTNYDWGVYNAISNGGNQAGLWHVLTNDEWGYVFKTRSASTVNGTANARYAIAYINTGGTDVYGFILFPDTYTAGTPSGVTWGTINSGIGSGAGSSATWTACTLEGWNALESAGCVFLPAAGWRGGTTINAVNEDGGCWAGSYYPSATGHAYNTHIYTPTKYVQPQDHSNRYVGYSVRLVHDVN